MTWTCHLFLHLMRVLHWIQDRCSHFSVFVWFMILWQTELICDHPELGPGRRKQPIWYLLIAVSRHHFYKNKTVLVLRKTQPNKHKLLSCSLSCLILDPSHLEHLLWTKLWHKEIFIMYLFTNLIQTTSLLNILKYIFFNYLGSVLPHS